MVAYAPDVAAGLAAWEARLSPLIEQWQRRAEAVAIGHNLSDAVHPGEDLPAERPDAIDRCLPGRADGCADGTVLPPL